eukprot:SAG31_NODE_5497_length_2500_cov_2.330696_1_plen_109_part_00
MVWEDGKAAFIGEHSRSDGSPTARLCDLVLTRQATGAFDHSRPVVLGAPAAKTGHCFQPLEFSFPPKVIEAVAEAQAYVASEVAAHNWRAVSFSHFGKDAIKKFGECI